MALFALRNLYESHFLLMTDDDFLDTSSLKDILKRLPTPESLDNQPLTERLTGILASQHPEHNRLGSGEALGWALASLWREHFMPRQIASEFAHEWNNFLVLEVGFFYPFRKAKRVNRKLSASGFPKGLAQIGALLADEEHLTEVISDPYESALSDQSDVRGRILAAIVPNPNDPMKGAIPVTTVASRRDSALEALADLLRRLQPTEDQPVQPTPEPSTSEPAPINKANHIAKSAATEQVSKPVNEQDMPLDNFVVIDWWVKERFRQAASASDDTGLIDKARRLAEYLAAIQLQIETGPEPTPRLVLRNMQRALRGIGIQPERNNSGDSLIGLLQRTQILAAIDNRWEFTNPNLVDYFGARHISEYGQHWVSLRPRHCRLMQWTAACLTRRGDDERTRQFVADLGRALGHASDLSWLEMADLLVEFPRDQSPAICVLREQLGQALQRLATIKSNRLRCSVAEKSSRLGLDVGLANFDEPIEEVIPATDLERSVNEVGLGTLLHMLGVTKFTGPDSKLVEDAEVIRILVSRLQKPGDEFKLLCAAWLRRSSLQTVSINLDLKALWKSRPEFALEAIAKIASNKHMDDYTRTLARSILTKDDFIVRLWEIGGVYQPLVYTLLLAMDKRLQVKADSRTWQVVE